MNEIGAARATDAPALLELLTELGYADEVDAVTTRLGAILDSARHRVVLATGAERRVDGCVVLERRLTLEQDEHVEITALVVNSAHRRRGIGRALLGAAKQWALEQGLDTIAVRSNVARPESHFFYERIGYVRVSTSHRYRTRVQA